MKILENKVALVTGSSRGLGRAIALRYAGLGAKLVINYTSNQEAGEKVVEEIKNLGSQAIAVKADVSSVKDIKRLFQTAKQEFGKIDIVVVNAGIEIVDLPALDVTEEQFDKAFSINTKGAFFSIQEAAKNVEDKGRIIYVSSSTTLNPMKGKALYGGSKLAPEYMASVIAKEVGARGITVNTIVPTVVEGAGVNTDMSARKDFMQAFAKANPLGRLATLEDVANIAEFLASNLSSYITATTVKVTGGAIQ